MIESPLPHVDHERFKMRVAAKMILVLVVAVLSPILAFFFAMPPSPYLHLYAISPSLSRQNLSTRPSRPSGLSQNRLFSRRHQRSNFHGLSERQSLPLVPTVDRPETPCLFGQRRTRCRLTQNARPKSDVQIRRTTLLPVAGYRNRTRKPEPPQGRRQ